MKKKLGFGFLIGLIFFIIITYLFLLNGLPASFSVIKGSESTIFFDFPFNLYIEGKESNNLKLNGELSQEKYVILESGDALKIKGDKIGSSSLDFKLFGFLPLRTVTVNVLPDVKVYPGGQAIGVILRSKGVMVIGKYSVVGNDGHRYYPAHEAGIEVGDVIIEINGVEINDKFKLANIIQEVAGTAPLVLKIKDIRGKIKSINVSPVMDKNGNYLIGLYVDDGVAGVGTLTFYEPNCKEYGALGHEITEANSQASIEVRKGEIIEAQIAGINSGSKGSPGEKLGTFFQSGEKLGNITNNTFFGIYGKLNNLLPNPYFKGPIPVATIGQVKRGPAKMYTVVKGGKIQEFDINIDRVYRQTHPDEKGLIITITDPELKNITGGIVQGMSGSPIIQDGLLVGAITHVFVNEPTRGYGVFAEWMISQTDFFNKARASNF